MAMASANVRENIENLWQAAIQDLDDECKSLVDFNQERIDVLDSFLSITNDAKERMVDKSWSFTRKNGQRVFVRDILSRVTRWINHFKEIGDTIVQYDPVHAALPWAGVRFLLNIALGDANKYNQLLDAAIIISESICRNSLLEGFLNKDALPAATEVRYALVKLYTRILDYLGKAKTYYSLNTPKRFIQSGLFSSSELESTMDSIDQAQRAVDRLSGLLNLQGVLQTQVDVKRMLREFNAPVNRWNQSLHSIIDHMQEERRAKILRWISSEPYPNHHAQAKGEVLEGTGQWLLQDATYLKWKTDSASSMLWLHGIPGSGKSKLTSIVIEDALATHRKEQGPHPVYFYCSRNPAEPGRSDPTAILASIMRQLSTPYPRGSLLPTIVKEYEEAQGDTFSSQSFTFTKVKEIIVRLLGSYQNTAVTIVVDALDECNEYRGLLLDWLNEILEESPCLLKIFISSRDDGDIVYRLKTYPELTLSSSRNLEDIATFVRLETKRLVDKGHLLRHSQRKQELCQQIIEGVTSGAHGMFRWASLQLHTLCRASNDDTIIARLGKLPKGLEDTYQEILDKVEANEAVFEQKTAQKALCWLLCARDQLKSADFLEAVSESKTDSTSSLISKEQLLELSFSLIIYDDSIDVFRFSHLSVREFLENHAYSSAFANALVAEACLCYVSNKLFATSILMQGAEPPHMVKYSYLFWAEHAQHAIDQKHERLRSAAAEFLRQEKQTDSCFALWWFQLNDGLGRRESRNTWAQHQYLPKIHRALSSNAPSALFVACAYDLVEVFGVKEWTVLCTRYHQSTESCAIEEVAARCGSLKLIKWYFRNQLPFAITDKVLEAAAKNEDKNGETLALLLRERDKGIKIGEDVFIAAAENGRGGDKNMELLLHHSDQDVEIGTKTLMAAAKNWSKREKIIETLENYLPRIQITDEIMAATARNESQGEKSTQLLLRHRNKATEIGTSVLTAAASNRQKGKEILTLIVKHDKHIKIDTGVLIAILWEPWDIESGREILDLLLEMQTNSTPVTEQTLLSVIESNRYNMLVLLIEKCWQRMEITEKVVEAAARQRSTMLDILLQKSGGKIPISQDVIKAAAQNTHDGQRALTLLLNKHAPNIRITEEILIWAAKHGTSQTLELLLDRREANVPITEGIVMASITGRRDTFRFLLSKHESDIQITSGLLVQAAQNGVPGSLKLLLDRCEATGIAVTKKVIDAAAGNDEFSVIMLRVLFKSRTTHIPITQKIFELAAGSLNSRLMSLLLERPDVDAQITDEMFIFTAERGEFDTMSLLLERREPSTDIVQEIIEAAWKNKIKRHSMLEGLLGKYAAHFSVTEELLKTAAESLSLPILALILEASHDEVPITQEIVSTIVWKFDMEKRLRLFMQRERRRTLASITRETCFKAACEGPASNLEFLCRASGHEIDPTWKLIAQFNVAVQCDNVNEIKQLFGQGVYPDIRGKHGRTPLWRASRLGNEETVKILAGHKDVDVNSKDTFGASPIIAASSYGKETSVEILIAAGARIDLVDNDGISAIMAASSSGSETIVKILLAAGARVNVVNNKGKTAVSLARGFKKEKIVRLLVDAGLKELRPYASRVQIKTGWRELLSMPTVLLFHYFLSRLIYYFLSRFI